MTAYTGSEVVGLFLSGGSDNANPSDSLGGAESSQKVLGLYPQILTAISGLVVEDATPECGEGVGSISVSGDDVTYTPPSGVAGDAVSVAAGETKFVTGQDSSKGVWVSRVAGLDFSGTCTFRLVDQMNGVLSMSDVPDADRQAGSVCYRAVFLRRLGQAGKTWLWVTTDGQSSWALAQEDPESDGSIQTISDEETPPAGLSWESAVDEATALLVSTLPVDGTMGIWIRRTFPAAGTVSADEQVNFHLKVEEGG